MPRYHGSQSTTVARAPDVVVDVGSPSLAAGLRSILSASDMQVYAHVGAAGGDVIVVADPDRVAPRAGVTGVVAVLDSADPAQLRTACAAGARGVVLRDGPADTFLAAVNTVHDGHSWLSGPLYSLLVRDLLTPAPAKTCSGMRDLTPREREVLVLMTRGLGTAEMAAALVISTKTVKLHVSNILCQVPGLVEAGFSRLGGLPGEVLSRV